MSKILAVAQKYIGLKEDAGSNKFGDLNPLKALTKAAGHKDGEPWCCYLQEGFATEAYPHADEWLEQHMSANCVQCYKNFVAAGLTVSAAPRSGWLAFYQLYKDGQPTTKGHVNLISRALVTGFMTIDGNSGGKGEREATTGMVAENTWTLGVINPDGLNYMGCIDLESWLASLPKKS